VTPIDPIFIPMTLSDSEDHFSCLKLSKDLSRSQDVIYTAEVVQ